MTKVLVAVFAWLTIGTLVGGLSFLLTGIIPFLGVGLILGIVGAVIHSILILFGRDLHFWQGGLIVAFVSSTISIVAGTLGGDHFGLRFILYFLIYYSVFGVLLNFLIEKYIIPFFIQ
jgi:uncharacterized membrane protein YvlD (DUF360 family)